MLINRNQLPHDDNEEFNIAKTVELPEDDALVAANAPKNRKKGCISSLIGSFSCLCFGCDCLKSLHEEEAATIVNLIGPSEPLLGRDLPTPSHSPVTISHVFSSSSLRDGNNIDYLYEMVESQLRAGSYYHEPLLRPPINKNILDLLSISSLGFSVKFCHDTYVLDNLKVTPEVMKRYFSSYQSTENEEYWLVLQEDFKQIQENIIWKASSAVSVQEFQEKRDHIAYLLKFSFLRICILQFEITELMIGLAETEDVALAIAATFDREETLETLLLFEELNYLAFLRGVLLFFPILKISLNGEHMARLLNLLFNVKANSDASLIACFRSLLLALEEKYFEVTNEKLSFPRQSDIQSTAREERKYFANRYQKYPQSPQLAALLEKISSGCSSPCKIVQQMYLDWIFGDESFAQSPLYELDSYFIGECRQLLDSIMICSSVQSILVTLMNETPSLSKTTSSEVSQITTELFSLIQRQPLTPDFLASDFLSILQRYRISLLPDAQRDFVVGFASACLDASSSIRIVFRKKTKELLLNSLPTNWPISEAACKKYALQSFSKELQNVLDCIKRAAKLHLAVHASFYRLNSAQILS